jgi:hypothetical protein
MNRTEERLVEALAARAAIVREDDLRPLVAPQRQRGRLRIAAPVASAVALTLAVGFSIWIGQTLSGSPGRPVADAATATSPPPYYVQIEGKNGNVVAVHATVGGHGNDHVTDRVRAPQGWYMAGKHAWLQEFQPSTLASARDRLFVVSFNNPARHRTGLFQFGLTASGKVTKLHKVAGGDLPGLVDISMAVSPDMRRVAIAGLPAPRHAGDWAKGSAKIIVVDLRTGGQTVIQGGMSRPGQQFSIPSLAWTPNGKSLIYVAQWCQPQQDVAGSNALCGSSDGRLAVGQPVSEVRKVSAAAGDSTLNHGPVLLRPTRRYPDILQVVMTRPGRIIALVRRGHHPSLVQFAIPGGRLAEVLYPGNRWNRILAGIGLNHADLSVDGSGNYLIVQADAIGGWIHEGRFHFVEPAEQGTPSITW